MDATLQEVEDLKVQLYNKTKDMTDEESIAYIHKIVVEAAEKYGFTLNLAGRCDPAPRPWRYGKAATF